MRSRRSIVTLGVAGLAFALGFGALAAVAVSAQIGLAAGVALAAGSLGGAAIGAWAGWRLRTWPTGKLGFFRDRLVVIQGKHEIPAVWAAMETVNLPQTPLGPFQFTSTHDVKQTVWVIAMDGKGGFTLVHEIK